ncbi:hypothetical protein [Rhodopseudomonas palustris]|uniref:Uncharacterized protein n=1 Tax=Rhodopseudomonas palustris (strain ATCC BAA-98 / CGA009) TaxID=258594 RepID=A0AAE9XYJ1_RHOPA|nr:hypothetical protein [Rhodopseudomonas palustris]WAB80030.1 hypothetical protein OR798_12285 [Rhodopseudomonas palustris]WCL92536.1 hypothetical protein TX73_012280 [Rhodopseudomonas palustris CGA009]WND53920.1 hypothetical protein L1A21_12240 [Rhodopseudomonas palustris]
MHDLDVGIYCDEWRWRDTACAIPFCVDSAAQPSAPWIGDQKLKVADTM